MEEIPEYIFLQLDGDGGDEYFSNCATWQDEQIIDTDVKYKRVRAQPAVQAGGLYGKCLFMSKCGHKECIQEQCAYWEPPTDG